ncbi:signal peptidase I [Lachnospiraceae bacterium 48-42]|nr:signal peptidase I [Dorea sp.]
MRRTRRRRGRRRKPLSRRWERKRQRYILQEAQTSVRYYLSYIPMIAVWIFRVAGICVFAFLIVWHLGQRVSMIGDSMNPILRNGDVVLVNRLVYNARRPRRGDIIVFKPKGNENSHYYIKRVIGLPGEKVEFRENEIYINGNRLEEKYQSTAVDRTGIVTEKMELGSDEYFVLGDDRENSEDSRDADVGNVKREHIFGKAWFVISPRDSFGFIKE